VPEVAGWIPAASSEASGEPPGRSTPGGAGQAFDRAPLAASLPRRSPWQASASRSSPRSTRDRLAGMRRGMSSGGSRTSREVHLAARPQGEPVASDFGLVDG
jgi:hypothetical protein